MIEEIGRKLRQAREEKSLTHEQVSRELRIRVQYLKALEEGDLSVLPSAVQVRGFLRSYADFLGLNPDELLNQDVKSNSVGRRRPTTREELVGNVRSYLRSRQRQPGLVQNYFKGKHVTYAA